MAFPWGRWYFAPMLWAKAWTYPANWVLMALPPYIAARHMPNRASMSSGVSITVGRCWRISRIPSRESFMSSSSTSVSLTAPSMQWLRASMPQAAVTSFGAFTVSSLSSTTWGTFRPISTVEPFTP